MPLVFGVGLISPIVGALAVAGIGIGAQLVKGLLFRSDGIQQLIDQTEGLKVIREGEDPKVDIIFVHGLGGDPVSTWTWKRDDKVVNWTADLLPEAVPDARILTYGYSVKLFLGLQGGLQSQPPEHIALKYLPQAVYLHSNRLINQLADLRAKDGRDRPVIFVAHSLGGLIVKSALVNASASLGPDQDRLKRIELLTVGTLFFGTPQREMLWAKWCDFLNKISGPVSRVIKYTPSSGNVNPLTHQAALLNLQTERYKSIESGFLNFSFFEKPKTAKGSSGHVGIVNEETAVPDHTKDRTWKKIPLDRLHRDLVKFDSAQNEDFLKVIGCIKECLSSERLGAASRHCIDFFRYTDSPRPSLTPELTRAKKDFNVRWKQLEPSLYRVDTNDSEQETAQKQKANQLILDKTEKKHGLSDMTTLEVVRQLARNSLETSDYDKAEALYKRLFVSLQETYAPCSVEVAEALEDVADVAIHQGRLMEATIVLCHVRDIRTKLGQNSHSLSQLDLTEQIGDLCTARRLFDEGLQEYHKICEHFKAKEYSVESIDALLRLKGKELEIWLQKGRADRQAVTLAAVRQNEIHKLKEDRTRISQEQTSKLKIT